MDTSQDTPDDFTRQTELDKHVPPDTQHTVNITLSLEKLKGNHTHGFYKNIFLEVLTPPPDSFLI
ncbi:hypothetical protein MWU59_10850 [Flavobacteriaceae bacterium F08102]|nr:hypothetical protein [Flavobacteriaceae bacterium F08102]